METTISRFLSWHDCEPECDHDLREVLATDAAQRETMEQQAGEIERLQVELLASRSHVEAWSAQVQKERNTLAAMTAERDEQGRLKADLHQRFKDAQQQLVKQDIMIVELEEKLESVAWEMREQLAASQARVGELEAEKQSSDFLRKRAFEELQKQVATSRQLQATLAEREQIIQQQEATLKGYRHSFKIVGQQHDDRKCERDAVEKRYAVLEEDFTLACQQRDAAVQDAARLREALELVITEWSSRGETTYLYEWGNRVKDAVEQAQKALKGA